MQQVLDREYFNLDGWLSGHTCIDGIDDMQMSSVQSHQQHKLSASYREDYVGKRECHPQYAYGLGLHRQTVPKKGD